MSDVSFELRPSEILAIMGPNGAGKTTLIDLLATVLLPTSGSLIVAGVDAVAKPGDARHAIGYLPSGSRSLYPRLTALENLRFFASLHGYCPTDAVPRAHAALRLCGAAEIAGMRVDRLSDGMAARVGLARAMLHDPAVLLLDEPTRSIDPVHRPTLLRGIRRYADQPGKAVVMVTHDVNEVFEICDRVGVMKEGRLLQLSDVAAVERGPDVRAMTEHLP